MANGRSSKCSACGAWAVVEHSTGPIRGRRNRHSLKAMNWGSDILRGYSDLLRYDNLTSAVKKILRGYRREETERFIVFRSHWKFQAEFCTPGEGHEKGGVEGEAGYFRRNHWVPVPKARDLADLNAQLLAGSRADEGRKIGDGCRRWVNGCRSNARICSRYRPKVSLWLRTAFHESTVKAVSGCGTTSTRRQSRPEPQCVPGYCRPTSRSGTTADAWRGMSEVMGTSEITDLQMATNEQPFICWNCSSREVAINSLKMTR